ncbi:MAG TPA: CopD family protein [Nocardioides sp.]|nr:CopD family protein [Nocardioides sp.]
MRRLLALLLLALIGVGGTAAPASAHATLVSTDPAEGAVLPAAPDTVTFVFDEPVRLVPQGLRAFDADGHRVDVEASAKGARVEGDLLEALADGTYVITWRVVSTDGHPIAGSLTFHIGAPSPRVRPPDAAAEESGAVRTVTSVVQAVDYIALLLAGGLSVFLAWTVRGIDLPAPLRRRLVRTLRGAALVAVLAALVAVPLAGAYQLGTGISGVWDRAAIDPTLVGDDVLVLLLHLGGLAVACWAADRRRFGLDLDDLLVALAVWSPALVGHTRAYQPSALLVVTDALHLTAGAVWLGGLVGLAITLPVVGGRPREAAMVLSRFSALAGGLVAMLAVTGVLMGWRIVGSWSLLFGQTYGRLLLVKVALVLVVVAIAGWNRFALLPRVTADGGHEGRRRGAGTVRRVVGVEASLVVVVLAVTGVLTQHAPRSPVSAAPGTPSPAIGSALAGDFKVLVALDARSGLRRRLVVQVQDLAGDPVDLHAAPVLALRSDDVDLGEVPVTPEAAGTYVADVVFPSPGRWKAQVSLRVDELTSPVATVAVDVS